MIHNFPEVAYRLDDIRDERIDRVRQAVGDTFLNGGMLIACFVPTLSEDYALEPSDDSPVRRFLACPAISRLVPELQPISPLPHELQICTLGQYAFEGEIIQLLLTDGCHCRSGFTIDSARMLATDFTGAVKGNGVPDFTAFRIEGHWAEWFQGIGAHAVTYVLPRPRKWWLMCAYDTD